MILIDTPLRLNRYSCRGTFFTLDVRFLLYFLINFLNSLATNTELETRVMVSQSHIESGRVPRATWNGGRTVTRTLATRQMQQWDRRDIYFLNKPNLKTDWFLDLQLSWTSETSFEEDNWENTTGKRVQIRSYMYISILLINNLFSNLKTHKIGDKAGNIERVILLWAYFSRLLFLLKFR